MTMRGGRFGDFLVSKRRILTFLGGRETLSMEEEEETCLRWEERWWWCTEPSSEGERGRDAKKAQKNGWGSSPIGLSEGCV